MIDIKQLLTAPSAARLCKITPRAFYGALAAGKGPASVLVDGHRFFLEDDVKAWDKTRRKRSKKPA